MKNEVKIVVGSWGSYNACNDRALGSAWLTLNDEELFIQDIEGFEVDNCDMTNPKELFETLQDSEVLEDEEAYMLACAYIEAEGFKYWVERVEEYGGYWEQDLYLHEGDLTDYAYEFIDNCFLSGNNNKTVDFLSQFIDYEAVARYLDTAGAFYQTSYGLLEIC